jgi:hypothetical protein
MNSARFSFVHSVSPHFFDRLASSGSLQSPVSHSFLRFKWTPHTFRIGDEVLLSKSPSELIKHNRKARRVSLALSFQFHFVCVPFISVLKATHFQVEHSRDISLRLFELGDSFEPLLSLKFWLWGLGEVKFLSLDE